MALLNAGLLSGSTDDLLQAWDFRPSRAEAPYHLIKKFNDNGNHTAAFALSKGCENMDESGDMLFVETWIEQYGLAFESAIAHWWGGEREAANAEFRRLLEQTDLPDHYRSACEYNLTFGD